MSELTKKFEAYLNSTPINIEGMIRLFNIELDKNAELHSDILGEIRCLENGKYKISVQKQDHYFRKRFTMAHEFAHFLLHRDKIGDGVDDNVAYRSTSAGNFYNQNITAKEETEANQLAASLLMPDHLLLPYITSNTSVEALVTELAKKFQVSTTAMRIRLSSLKTSSSRVSSNG